MSPEPAPVPLLAVRDVGIRLGGHEILRGVDFEQAAGEFVGVIGPNGAGKTTLLRAVLGLQRVSGGRVLLDGRAPSRAHHVAAYLPQKVAFDPDLPLRARDVIALGVDGHRLGLALPSRRRSELVDEMIDAVDAADFAESRIGRLSGGQQQRILLAQALVSRPRLLVLDEPLASLDLRSSSEIVALLRRVAAERQVAVLLTAHDLNALLPAMDRLVYVANGRAVVGTADEVVRSDVLSALYDRRVDVLRVEGRVLVVAGDDDGHEHGHEHGHEQGAAG